MLRVTGILACVALVACSAPMVAEEHGETTSHIEGGRYDPNADAPQQTDDWSCSVHTAAWMLHATGNRESLETVRQQMLATGRVTQANGLSDATGAGLAQTLRDLASDSPAVSSTGSASFDEVAAKAGRMAVGIGGRAWNHWSGVRGYDANADVLLLASSAEGFKGVGTTMNRAQFASLGGMSMVWMDYGGGAAEPAAASDEAPEAAPFVPAERPASDPFPALYVKAGVSSGSWITQCNEDGDAERVWQTDGTGPDPSTYWAPAMYPQEAKNGCGTASDAGIHPLVFRSLHAGDIGGQWVVQCSGFGDGAQHVFYIDSEVDGHPAASFQYNEANPDCD
jgi:hypothetical protein